MFVRVGPTRDDCCTGFLFDFLLYYFSSYSASCRYSLWWRLGILVTFHKVFNDCLSFGFVSWWEQILHDRYSSFFLPREAISVVYVDPSLHSFSNSTVPNGVHLFYVAQQRTVRIRSKALIIWLMLTIIDGETKDRQLTTRTKLSTSNV